MANKFEGFLEAIGKDAEKGLLWAVREAPVVDKLAAAIWPASVVVTGPATAALNLIQNEVLAVEQKYAASGAQNGTGAQKSAEVLALVGPAATELLTEAKLPGIAVDATYVSGLVTAIVGILNVQPPPVAVAVAPTTGLVAA